MAPLPLEDLKARQKSGRLPRPGTQTEAVLAFLRTHEKEGWRAAELSDELGMDPQTLGSLLRRLRARGLVDQIEEHWFALDDREVARRQAILLTTRLANEKWGPENPAEWASLSQE